MNDTAPKPPISRDWLRIVGAFAVVAILSTTVILVATSLKFGQQSELISESRRNHEASVCIISVFHQISASSGRSEQERKEAFDVIFGEQWLVDHCALTAEEAKRVVSDG